MEANFIKPSISKDVMPVQDQERNRRVEVNVMFLAKGCLELNLTASRGRFLQVQHRVATGDSGPCGSHGMPFLDHLVP